MPKAQTWTIHPTHLAQMCRNCGHIGEPRITPGRGPHVAAAYCQGCGAFMKWIPKRLVTSPPVSEKTS
jgi:hypothetical protein